MNFLTTNFYKDKYLSVANERSQKFHVLKYKSLISRLEILYKGDYLKATKCNFFDTIIKIKALELVNNATDFFWSSVHRLSSAIDKSNHAEIERTHIFFLQNFFDSFYLLLPKESQLSFRNISTEDVLFPKLEISIVNCKDLDVVVCKQNQDSLIYTFENIEGINGGFCQIDLGEIPSFLKIKKEIIQNSTSILYQRHESLFEDLYCHTCCKNVFLGHLLKIKIDKAFDRIKIINYDLFEKITNSLEYIIPYGNDLEKRYPNFAIATLKRTIFLSIDLLRESEILLMESIVHEYHHCELHSVQDTVLFMKVENDETEYYSPWRKDPRTLLGLLHGIYVSHEIVCFYNSMIDKKNNRVEESAQINKSIEILIHQIFIAIKQIQVDQLTEFTKELLSDISLSTNQISQKLFSTFSIPPKEITDHIATWRLNNNGSVPIIE